MNEKYKIWVDGLIGNNTLFTPNELSKRRLFINVVVFTFFYTLFYIPVCVLFEYQAGLITVISTLLLIPITLFIFSRGKHFLSINLYLLIITFACIYLMYKTGGLMGSPFTPQWLAVPFILAVLISSRKIAIVYLVISCLAMAFFGISEILGYDFEIDMNLDYVLTFNTIAQIGFLLTIFLVAITFDGANKRAYSVLNKLRREAESHSRLIDEERKKSDELLLNILPEEVMQELKETGKTQAKNYDLVTVLFADVVDFTLIIEEMEPEILVITIDAYFIMIDNIISKHNIEKIKTVGDAYICAAGLGSGSSSNPVAMVDVALEIMNEIARVNVQRAAAAKPIFELRIGIHSGPLVAGVVGIKKFAYDIWGDTVNTAARMQQNSDSGRINISGTTRELVKHRFNCTHRGRFDAKHKGLIDMYFVDERK